MTPDAEELCGRADKRRMAQVIVNLDRQRREVRRGHRRPPRRHRHPDQVVG
ncbi:MAG: hypothetical protein R2695_15890 [Acidimicrobiales bacterium]